MDNTESGSSTSRIISSRRTIPGFASIALFAGLYVAIFSAGSYLLPGGSIASYQWIALAAAVLASVVLLRLERRGDLLGLRGRNVSLARDLALGATVALVAVGVGDLVMLATTTLRHGIGEGIDARELWLLFLPAAVHEEVLFRGFVFQRLASWSRAGSVILTSIFFAVLHLGNAAVGPLALLNIFLAGLLLGTAFFVFRSLWFPIAIHWTWNAFSGPVLGHEVSGFQPAGSLLTSEESGPALLTGGSFGVEGSIYMTVIEVLVIAFLSWVAWKRDRNESNGPRVDTGAEQAHREMPLEEEVPRLENA